jgi:hypothetical protein
MKRLAVSVLFVAVCACGHRDEPAPPQRGSAAATTQLDEEVRRSLVLDAALAKGEKELVALEAASPRDERVIAEKREGIEALKLTIAETKKRVERLQGLAGKPLPPSSR